MRIILNPNTSLWDKVSTRSFRLIKEIYHRTRFKDQQKTTKVFILGCQRSGTTLMYRIFDRDLNTKVYREQSKLSSNDEKAGRRRLNSLQLVKKELDKDKAPLIILKPLVETQNSLRLLNYFEGSKGLWMYRHYKDVVASNLKQFGIKNGINNLRTIVENDSQDWRSENVPENIRKIVLKYFSEDMNANDAAALFWFVRNTFFFEFDLDTNSNVMIYRYEKLVEEPLLFTKKIYEFLGYNHPGEKIIKDVHPKSVGKGKQLILSREIDLLCRNLLEDLDKACQRKVAY